MSRKDYMVIAAALYVATHHVPNEDARMGAESAAEYIANALQDDNPRFDRERFMRAVRGE